MRLDTRAMSLELAMEYHREGKLAEAEQIYRAILRRDARHIDANYLLGLIELDRGRYATAAVLITRSRDLSPNNPLYHYNLGRAHEGIGEWQEAEECYRKAIHHRNDYVEARYALGHLLQVAGRDDLAIVEYKKLLRINPSLAPVYNNLGNALSRVGRLEEGLKNMQRAVEMAPDYVQGWGNLGNMLQTLGRTEAATEAFETALRLDPNCAEQLYNFGNLKQLLCDYEGAIALYRRATESNPALACAFNNLGNVYKLVGRLREAIDACELAIEKDPKNADPLSNLGNALLAAGQIPEAIERYREAVALAPHFVDAYSNLLYALNYPSGIEEQEILAEHREWSRRFEWPVEVKQRPEPRPPAGRRLRIGYVSGDFRRHSVAFFFEPLLEAHDRSRFEVYCYAQVLFFDDVTERIVKSCDHWRPISGLDDNQAAEQIRRDQIDILVDLSGHTVGNRLLVFARRPAPLQLTWLGYPNTTGTNCIDYRLVDAITDPPGTADTLASEGLYRLPRGFLCYRGYEQAPYVVPPPSIRKGYITFGSFNNLSKVTREVVALWSEILHAVPNSHLLLKTNQLEDTETREKYLGWFGEHGIPRERIDLRPRTHGLAEHLGVYGEVDIALDTFPYNGTTTTCEALWMGVPVVTLAGESHRSRVSQSILTHAGMGDLVASDRGDLLAIIQALVTDPEALRARRVAMRKGLASSPLCNFNEFTRSMEHAFTHLFSEMVAQGAAPIE